LKFVSIYYTCPHWSTYSLNVVYLTLVPLPFDSVFSTAFCLGASP